jgi:hypothetical protein
MTLRVRGSQGGRAHTGTGTKAMSRHATIASEPLDGALVRLPITGDRWAEDLPPVPHGFDVTMSFSTEDAAAVHGEAVGLLGYRVVGVHTEQVGDAPCADVLVPQALIAQRPRWWRALTARADRSYGLAFGPVRLAVAEVLQVHTPKPAGW